MQLRPSRFLLVCIIAGVLFKSSRAQGLSSTGAATTAATTLQLGTTTTQMSYLPEEMLIQKILDLVTAYFSVNQVAQALQWTAFDIRRGFDTASIVNDVGQNMWSVLSPQQRSGISQAYLGMAADLGSETAADGALNRALLALIAMNQPVVAQLRQAISTSSNPSSNTAFYETGLSLLTAQQVESNLAFIHQYLAPNEWSSLVTRFSQIIRFNLYPGV